MNSELKDRVYTIPLHVMEFLKNQKDIPELDRNEHLLNDGTVTYGQLMRILHDMRKVKMSNPIVYNFYGGDLMYNWGRGVIQGDANQAKNSKEATKIANDISGLSGERENPSIKRHTKNTVSPKVNPNDITKPNSEKFTNSSMFSAKSMKLFEQISRMKKLMI